MSHGRSHDVGEGAAAVVTCEMRLLDRRSCEAQAVGLGGVVRRARAGGLVHTVDSAQESGAIRGKKSGARQSCTPLIHLDPLRLVVSWRSRGFADRG